MKKLLSILMVLVLSIGVLAGCAKEEKNVVVAAKPFTEGYIVAEMVALIIENETDITVERKYDIAGDATIIHQGLLDGEIDMYPEYTSTGWYYIIKQEEVLDDHDELYKQLQEKYNEIGLTWTGLYGFNNSYALTIRKDTQETYGITNTSDLIAVADQLTFGANFDYFEREDGYDALLNFYGFESFGDTKEVNIGLRYQALAEGEVDVINGFTTDGLIEKFDLVALEDDKEFFKVYMAATVVRTETLEKYPELADALDKLTGTMTDAELMGLNYRVDADGEDPEAVAKDYLIEKGLISE